MSDKSIAREAWKWLRIEFPTPYDKRTTRQVRRKARKCYKANVELWYRGKAKKWILKEETK